jgi:hypothetical protein
MVPPPMRPKELYEYLLAIVAAVSFVACKPEIGDDCTVSTDCSATGDRICDTTQPGGYCTIFNCEPGTCPEEAVCIAFGGSVSTRPECVDRQGTSPFQRTFCMVKCEGDDDCRDGYECIDMGVDNPWGARVAEHGVTDGRVCGVPFRGSSPPDDRQTNVCTGFDGDFEVPDAGRPPRDAGPTTDGGTPDANSDAPADSADADTDAASDAELD